MFKSKKYVDSQKLIEKSRLYDTNEAMDLVCKTSKAKFDDTIEVHVRLGVDSRHADQQVRKIAEQKLPDLNAADVDAATSMIAGTARSMGITVTD